MSEDDGRPKRGFWRSIGFLFESPFRAIGADSIRDGWRLIWSLSGTIRGSRGDEPLKVMEIIDPEYLARRSGLPVHMVEAELRRRQRQTARSFTIFGLGALGLLSWWLVAALRSPIEYTSITYAMMLLLLCSALFLGALYNALLNWQLRTRRIGSMQDFLRQRHGWWPRS